MASKSKSAHRTTHKTKKHYPERAPGKRRPSGGLTASERAKSATITQHVKGPRGGRTKSRFPMPDKAHARNALARLNQAKGLSSSQKAEIRARAHKILGE